MSSPIITKTELRQLFDYDPERGLIFKTKRGRYGSPGLVVGGQSGSRSQIRLSGVRVLVHHVIWFWHHGYWPSDHGEWIDHKDGNPQNNLIENLRVCTPGQNNSNSVSSGEYPKGVSFQQGRFRAIIEKDGNRWFLGGYPTVQEAAAAYEGASRVLHGEFSIYHR